MKILVISQLFPDSSNPHFGIFIKREVQSLESQCEQIVIAPRSWVPLKKKSDKTNENQTNSELKTTKVFHPFYFPLPGKLFLPVKGVWMFLFIFFLIKKIKKMGFDFDVIHAHKLFPEGFSAILLKKFFKKPIVVSMRGADITELKERFLIRPQLKYVLKQSDLIFSVSKSLKKRAIEVNNNCGKKIKIMAKGVSKRFSAMDKKEARESLNLPLDKKIVMSAGWFIPRKNPFAFIEVAKKLSVEERNNYLFIMVGEGPMKNQIQGAIQLNGLNSNFLLPGRVSPKEMPLWMNTADIFVLVSFAEGMPNVLYESMACGLPVIASNVDGAAEIITDGKDGYLIQPEDYDTLTNRIKLIFSDQNQKYNLGINALSHIKSKNLRWENNAAYLYDEYKRLAKHSN